jgi:aminopeptidase
MKDPRIEKLAHTLVTYSVKARKGDHVLIQNTNSEPELVRALIREVYAVGAKPFVSLLDKTIQREVLLQADEEQLRIMAENDRALMKEMDCYIGFSSLRNLSAHADVPQERMELYNRVYYEPVHMEQRLNHTRWVVLRFPSPALAQLSDMSEEAFENFYFTVCNLDYAKMSQAMDPLAALIEKTDKVRITGPGTDISFSIKGMPAIKCDGGRNIPDGEVYTAPISTSVNGIITYNTPSLHDGFVFENISFEFSEGKIIHATANNTERLNAVLDTDEGARYVGEFSFGLNPYILEPMKETLFDEKIAGSIHFTPGNAYTACNNGNRSAIQWDLVLIQRPEYGGGSIYFDDVLIRENGHFVHPDLEGLNTL